MRPDSQHHRYPQVLSVAGSDSGGGAGIQADLKTFAALGCFGMTAITALTAQNTTGVRAIHRVPAAMVNAQIDAVLDDIGVDAVKIGMLHSRSIVQAVARAIDRHGLRNAVLDPVMLSSSGAVLMQREAIASLVRALFPRVSLVTPNLDEAALLLGRSLESEMDMEEAAAQLLAKGAKAVLLKGGHLPGETVADLFWPADGEKLWMRGQRIHSRNTHGTGCTLSAAIAAHLALGKPLRDSVQAASAFVRDAIQAGSQIQTGSGSGPLNHGHSPHAMQRIRLY